jgi:phage protein D
VALPLSSSLTGLADVRAPRLRLLADGVDVPGVVEAEVVSNNHYAADRFRVAVALGATPAAVWAAGADVLADVQASLDGGLSWTSLVQGAVDRVEIDPLARMVWLDGRDLTASLIEARTQETFSNRTSSEIAGLLAARHGLSADVQATATLVGRYWQMEHDRITLDQFGRAITEWDLLVTLAQHEGFDVWVSGTTLHFRAPADNARAVGVLRMAGAGANVTSLRLERALTLARDIEVTVKSWNARQQTAFTQTARAQRGAGGAKAGARRAPQRYVYVVPNLSPDEALKLAQRRLAELTRHERVITAEMPGELALQPRMQVALQGSFTEFDQIYWIDEIERHVHVTSGFTQRLRARNASVGSQATSPGDPAQQGAGPWSGF